MSLPYIIICLFCVGAIVVGYFSYRITFRKQPGVPDGIMHDILLQHVYFYKKLSEDKEAVFRLRIQEFLHGVKITKIDKSAVTLTDRTLIGASAIIPIFNFPKWKYNNLSEIILYPNSFNANYETANADNRNILGMVGGGALRNTMLLSQKALYDGFDDHAKVNTAIHEFVHLIDMADGKVDGVPEHLIHKSLIDPWLHQIYTTIQEIKSDEVNIRKYATVNEPEFFSVVSEYFFLRPHYLKEEDPELFHLLQQIYNVSD